MALLCFYSPPSLSSRLQPLPLATPGLCRIHVGLKHKAIESRKRLSLGAECLSSSRGRAMMVAIVKATVSDVDGTGSESNEVTKAVVPVEKLPLESKEEQLMEQRMKMKLAKKIRLRRKRLVRKRKMRKKGRWPPSKMKKLNNV